MQKYPNELKHFEDIVNWIFDSAIEQFGEPTEFDYFDRNVLFSSDEIKKTLDKDYSDLGITEMHFNLYKNNGLLPELNMEDGNSGFPNYTSSRIEFLYNLIDKWGYDFKRLKKITSYEEMLIELYTKDEFEYRVSFLFDDNDIIKSRLQKAGERFDDDNESLLNLTDKFDGLPKENQFFIKKVFYYIEYRKEHIRVAAIDEFRKKLLLGFSPTVRFDKIACSCPRNQNLSKNGYVYVFECEPYIYLYGDWIHPETAIEDGIDFFSTPEFLLEFENDKIYMVIRNPQKVDSHYMRRIEKVYSLFRKELKPKKKRWGEKSGRKRLISERNQTLKDLYNETRSKKPFTSANKQLEKAIEKIIPKYGEISFDTAKRIIYTKK